MTFEADTVVVALRHLLKRVEEAAAAVGNELPARRYATTGGAVFDCPQVSVSGNSLGLGLATGGGEQDWVGGCGPMWNVQVEVAIVRGAAEKPSVSRTPAAYRAPTVEAIETDTVQASADAATLERAIELTTGGATDQFGTAPASMQFGEVSGGLTAVLLTTTLNLWHLSPPA